MHEAHWPSAPDVRVDTHIVSGARIPPFYDSLMAKIIAHGRDRASALHRLRSALAETRVEGVKTNLSFHSEVLAEPEFSKGGVDTGYLSRFLDRRSIPSEI